MEEAADFRAEDFGLIKLPIPVPPMLETALGYPGNERYVALHECLSWARGFVVEDFEEIWPGVSASWSLFCSHPAVAQVFERLGLGFKRNVPIMSWADRIALPSSQRMEFWSKTRYLVLDRKDRVVYVSSCPKVQLFLTMESAFDGVEPDDENREVISQDFEAKVDLPGFEKDPIFEKEPIHNADKPVAIGRAVLQDLRAWLDNRGPLDDDYTPAPPESCGFRRTYISLEPGQIEDAFDYRGGRRYITLHWSHKANQVFVCDGIGRRLLSDAVETWNEFLHHPLIEPHLQSWDESERPWKSVLIDFAARIDKRPECELFSNEQSAREMEAEVKTNVLLYDRAYNDLSTGSWASALLFHSLVEDVLEEHLVEAPSPARSPVVASLNASQEDPERLFAVAASYHQHDQGHNAFVTLRRCIEQAPHSHLYWFRLSQALDSHCKKAIAFRASAQRKHMTEANMLKGIGQCLFCLQQYSEAAEAYRFAIEVDDRAHRSESYSELARCYEKMGAYRDAIRACELKVRERADSVAQAMRYRESDDIEDEIVDSERFFLGEAWFDLGRCYLFDGNFEAAEWALRRVITTSSQCARAYAELGALLLRLGRPEEADGLLHRVLDLVTAKVGQHPSLGSAHSDLAFVYAASGNSEANRAYQRSAELGWKSTVEEQTVVSIETVDKRNVS
jgi:tetratricopeptide (TPR) repeat protein